MLLSKQAQIVPSDTSHEHLQRIEEWTQNSTSAPPSNRKRTPKEQENHDLEVRSQLIVEAVQLLDNRERQTTARSQKTDEANPNGADSDNDDKDADKDKEPQVEESIGQHFRNSNMSAKLYVKSFEDKIKRKKAHAQALASMYPSVKPKGSLLKGPSIINANPSGIIPVVEPDSWRHKATRSVKFAVKSGSLKALPEQKPSEVASEDGEKWTTKKENDADWWRWKLKQRFLQNDELLHRLASQRQKREFSSTLRGDNDKITKKSVTVDRPIDISRTDSLKTTMQTRNSSWHIGVEIPSHMTPSMTNSKRLAVALSRSSEFKARDPIPNFYVPSKQLVSAMTNKIGFEDDLPDIPDDAEDDTVVQLKTLKKDPYLSKLLAGNELFKPEMMLENNNQQQQQQQQQRKSQLSHMYTGSSVNNPRRKISLESLADTEDDATASKFFNPDVTILYERLSEMEINEKNSKKNKPLGVSSREPSDGFFNMSLLLQTGRFNHYNKLPSMKLLGNRDTLSKEAKKSEKSGNSRSSKRRSRNNGSNPTRFKVTSIHPTAPVGIDETIAIESIPPSVNTPEKIEDLPTVEWAKKIMSKVKKRDISTKTDGDGKAFENGNNRRDDISNMLNIPQQGKYKVPIDQETNLLYHEILMSKWKKDKHNREKENDIGRNKYYSGNAFGKWGDRIEKKVESTALRRPKGLDIWLENIRERAKRDRVISPLPISNNDR